MRGGQRRTKHGGKTWWKKHGAPNRKWWKYGGNNVVEVETKNFLKKKFPGEKKRIGLHFSFHPVFSTTYFHHIFHHVKLGVATLLLLLLSFFSFL